MDLEVLKETARKAQYYLVQYSKEPHTLVYEVVKVDDIIWEKYDKYRLKVFNITVRDQGDIYLGNIFTRGTDKEVMLRKYAFLKEFVMREVS